MYQKFFASLTSSHLVYPVSAIYKCFGTDLWHRLSLCSCAVPVPNLMKESFARRVSKSRCSRKFGRTWAKFTKMRHCKHRILLVRFLPMSSMVCHFDAVWVVRSWNGQLMMNLLHFLSHFSKDDKHSLIAARNASKSSATSRTKKQENWQAAMASNGIRIRNLHPMPI